MCASRSAKLSGAAWRASGASRTGSVIMPAPQVNCVAGSIRMKLPVPRFRRSDRTRAAARSRLHVADLVQHQRVVDFGGDRPRAVLQQVDARRVERPLVHPDEFGLELLSDERRLARQDVAAADVDLVVQRERDRHRREATSRSPSKVTMRLTRALRPDGQAVTRSPTRRCPRRSARHSRGTHRRAAPPSAPGSGTAPPAGCDAPARSRGYSSSGRPSNYGVRSLRVMTLSPLSALIGMAWTDGAGQELARSRPGSSRRRRGRSRPGPSC